ncbi:putative ribonuclease H-like domain-containing protein [Tanacetum coccineum]
MEIAQSAVFKQEVKCLKFWSPCFCKLIHKQGEIIIRTFQHCLFACFLSQNEPKKISEALEDESWVDAMQEELLQFKIQKVWILVDLPYGKKAIGTKWCLKEIRRMREELWSEINHVYQIDVKSAFLYGKIDVEVYVSQPPGFIDPKYPQKILRIDLFGPTSIRSLNHKTYCLVITDDFSRDFIEFCGSKGIKREYSNVRTPQQKGVSERKNRTLIVAARTMLADSFLPNTFWAEAVSTACYVLNRVLVTKPQNKTPYELITSKIPIISYIRPFEYHVAILNTIDHLGKFDGKSDEGFLVGYSLNTMAFRVYNLETKRVEENLHITFLENKQNVAGKGPNWLFDLYYLTDSMNYQPVRSENQANKIAGPKEANHSAVKILEAKNEGKKPNKNTSLKINEEPVDQEDQAFLEELERLKRQEKKATDAVEAFRKEFA